VVVHIVDSSGRTSRFYLLLVVGQQLMPRAVFSSSLRKTGERHRFSAIFVRPIDSFDCKKLMNGPVQVMGFQNLGAHIR
jgi:hypothetical protein